MLDILQLASCWDSMREWIRLLRLPALTIVDEALKSKASDVHMLHNSSEFWLDLLITGAEDIVGRFLFVFEAIAPVAEQDVQDFIVNLLVRQKERQDYWTSQSAIVKLKHELAVSSRGGDRVNDIFVDLAANFGREAEKIIVVELTC